MRKVLRTQQIYIDLPKPGAEPWMNIIVQYVEMSDDLQTVLNTVDRWNQIAVRVSSIATEVHPFTDPLPVPDGMISNYGVVQAMTLAVISLIIAKFGGALDPVSGLIILE